MGKEMKMAGFRKGKIPAEVVIQRIGRDAVVDETIRGSLGHWYSEAVDGARLAIVGQPEVELGELPAAGEPLVFSFEVGVRPVAKLGKYKGLKVERREAAAAPEAIDEQIEELRGKMASLEAVEEPATSGDFVVMNYVGSIDGEVFEGGEGTDQLIELGRGGGKGWWRCCCARLDEWILVPDHVDHVVIVLVADDDEVGAARHELLDDTLHLVVHRVHSGHHHDGQLLVHQRQRAMLHLARVDALAVHV